MANESEALVRRAARGDAEAVEALIRLHEPNLLAFIRIRAPAAIRERESVRDLLQEILLGFIQGLEKVEYRSEAEFRAWLYTLAERRIHDRARHHARDKRNSRGALSLDDPGAMDQLLAQGYSTAFSPAHSLLRKEEIERLETAFEQLQAEEREVLSLAYFCGMNSTEIAGLLGIQPEAARKRKNRARTRLAALWGADP